MQPLAGNIAGTGTHLLELANMLAGLSEEQRAFEEEFVASLPVADSADCDGCLGKLGAANKTDFTPLFQRTLFNDCEGEMTPIVGGGVNKVVVVLTNLANFPSNFGTVQNRFMNQNSDLNDEGYDYEGNLPHFMDEPNDNMEMYFEQAIEGGSVAEAVEAPAA
jgi:hypothetical protein